MLQPTTPTVEPRVTRRVRLSLEVAHAERLRAFARDSGLSMSDVVERWIDGLPHAG